MIVWGMDAIIVDVETAFLHGKLEEEIYMNLLEGMEGDENECLLLLKALYGLVQGAHQWWKKFMEILKTIEFKGGFADPCLMIKQLNDGTCCGSWPNSIPRTKSTQPPLGTTDVTHCYFTQIWLTD